jgi:hypothetical protein
MEHISQTWIRQLPSFVEKYYSTEFVLWLQHSKVCGIIYKA